MRDTKIVSQETQQRRLFATRTVKAQIKRAEKQLDAAGIELMKVSIALLEAREATGLSATIGHGNLNDVMQAIASWTQTRAATVEAHEALLPLARRIGTFEVAFGDGEERPPVDPYVAQLGNTATAHDGLAAANAA